MITHCLRCLHHTAASSPSTIRLLSRSITSKTSHIQSFTKPSIQSQNTTQSRLPLLRPFSTTLPSLSSSSSSTPPSNPDPSTNTAPKQPQIPSRLLIGFNCNKCSHRTHKLMSKKAYETGVVIITCDGCQAKHLIADHLGWFDTTQGKIGTIEEIIARQGGDREGNMVVRLRAKDVLTGEDGEGSLEGSGAEGDDGMMEWLPKRADKAAFGDKKLGGGK